VIYTSGSTGRPKGVGVRHHNVTRLLDSTECWFSFGAEDAWTLFHSYAFDFSVWELWGALLYGGRVVVVPYWVSRSPESFLELLRRQRVTVLNQTPSTFRQLVAAEEAAEPGSLALREVIFGGEALAPSSLAPWFARHGDARPRLVNMYGITETTVHVTWRALESADSEAEGRSPIGVPIPDLQLFVVDRWGGLVPPGVAGELCIGGAGLATGYLSRPALTATRFVPNGFSEVPGERLYRSGDLGRNLPSGELEYLGRIDFQVKVRGFRIELGEIESALHRSPSVREAVVLLRGEGSAGRLVAWVVPDGETSPEALREELLTRLPEYMVPAAFVQLERFPSP
jgi:amino acid adenylation domain-containing protein